LSLLSLLTEQRLQRKVTELDWNTIQDKSYYSL
jgi:hypothetical protein